MKNTSVTEIMSTDLVTLSPFDTLSTAKKEFDQNNIHHIPVLHEDKLVGMLSSSDLERSKQGKTLFINHDLDKHNESILEVTLIGMVMTEMVETISTSDSIYKAYLIFKEKYFRALPVFNKENLVGIITPMDFLDFIFDKNKVM